MTNSRALKDARLLTAVKSGDETTTSDNTLNDDADLQIPLVANKMYSFKLNILVKAHATPDFKFTLKAITSATGSFDFNAIGSNLPSTEMLFAVTNSIACDDSIQNIQIHGNVIMGAAAGTLIFQWCQTNSDANTTILKKGTSMEAVLLD